MAYLIGCDVEALRRLRVWALVQGRTAAAAAGNTVEWVEELPSSSHQLHGSELECLL